MIRPKLIEERGVRAGPRAGKVCVRLFAGRCHTVTCRSWHVLFTQLSSIIGFRHHVINSTDRRFPDLMVRTQDVLA